MGEESVFHWYMLLYPAIAAGYIALLNRLDRRWKSRRSLTEVEILAMHARDIGISEYALFNLAARPWSIGSVQVDENFKTYLQTSILPYYVRDYLRGIPNPTSP